MIAFRHPSSPGHAVPRSCGDAAPVYRPGGGSRSGVSSRGSLSASTFDLSG